MSRISDTIITMLTKGDEKYFFIYAPGCDVSRSECLQTLGRFASNPDLSFSWLDAATLSQMVRKQGMEAKGSCGQ